MSLRQQAFNPDYKSQSVSPIEQIASVEKRLKSFQDQLAEKAKDLERLRLVAPASGMVLPPTLVPRREDTEEKLPMWSGSPLDPENLGATIDAGVLFCQIGDPTLLDAVLVIDQADRNLVQDKQRADLKIESHPYMTLHGEITGLAESPLRVVPQRLCKKYGGEVDTKTDNHTAAEKPMSTCYQARVPVDDPDAKFELGIRGQARVYTAWVPLGTRLLRLLSHTFNFKL